MFRIQCFVEDKNLAYVMHALGGRALNLSVVPVVNAEPKNKKLMAKSDGKSSSLLLEWLNKNELATFTVHDVRQFLPSIGRKEASAYHIIKRAMDAGMVQMTKEKAKTGTRGFMPIYRVIA